MPIENPNVEQLKKINVIDNKLDDIDNNFNQKNNEFLKEMDAVKNDINDLGKQYNTFDERLKTVFDGLKKDYNDLFGDATINNQSYYSMEKITALKYSVDDVFNNNEPLFNSIHANRFLLPKEPTVYFKNILKDYAERNGITTGEKLYNIDQNFTCENGIDEGAKVFKIPGEYITEIKTGKIQAGIDGYFSFGAL